MNMPMSRNLIEPQPHLQYRQTIQMKCCHDILCRSDTHSQISEQLRTTQPPHSFEWGHIAQKASARICIFLVNYSADWMFSLQMLTVLKCFCIWKGFKLMDLFLYPVFHVFHYLTATWSNMLTPLLFSALNAHLVFGRKHISVSSTPRLI